MKFKMDIAKPLVAPKSASTYADDLAVACHAFEKMEESYQAMRALDMEIVEIEEMQTKARLAMTVLKDCGWSPAAVESLGIDTMLGEQAPKDVAAVENMAADKLKEISDKYSVALEGLDKEKWKARWEKIKAWFANFIEWFKGLFVGNTKLVKAVKEVKFESIELDPEAKFEGITVEQAQKLSVNCDRIAKNAEKNANALSELLRGGMSEVAVSKFEDMLNGLEKEEKNEDGTTTKESIPGYTELIEKNTQMSSGTVGDHKWTDDELRAGVSAYTTHDSNKSIAETYKKVSAAGMQAIKDAGDGIKEKVDVALNVLKVVRYIHTLLRLHEKGIRVLGTTFLRLSRKAKTTQAETK